MVSSQLLYLLVSQSFTYITLSVTHSSINDQSDFINYILLASQLTFSDGVERKIELNVNKRH